METPKMPSHARISHLLLTGATGVLGSQMLKQLLQRAGRAGSEGPGAATPSAAPHIHCLVRARTIEEGRQRLLDILSIYDPDHLLQSSFDSRVHVVLGDVTQPLLGLSPSEYHRLADIVEAVLHCAASTHLFLSFRRIEPINFGGTRNVVEFALLTRNRYMAYFSTYTVLGDKVFDASLTFRESDLDIGQSFPNMAYQHSKFLAEQHVRASEARGLRWNILRPGQIFGEEETGRYPQGDTNVTGLFLDIFKTITETGVAFVSGTHYDVSPVDYVAAAGLYLALDRALTPTPDQGSHGETYHLLNPEAFTYSDVVKMVEALGYPIEHVSQKEYLRRLLAKELTYKGEEYKSPTIAAFKWWLQRDPFDFTDSAITDSSYTHEILAQVGIAPPPIDLKLIGTYLNYGVQRGFYPTPAEARLEREGRHHPSGKPASQRPGQGTAPANKPVEQQTQAVQL